MINIPELPDNWFNLVGLTLINIVGLVSIWIKVRDTRSDVVSVREHTVNSHGTNLRDDIDDLGDDIRGLRDDIGQLRSEVRKERKHSTERLDNLERKIDQYGAAHEPR